MFSISKATIVFLTILISAKATSLPGYVPHSVRQLLAPVHLFHSSVDAQLDVAKQRLRLLNRELARQKERSKLITKSLEVSLVRSDLRTDESKSACNAVSNYNRSVIECGRLPAAEEQVEKISKVCMEAGEPEMCYANRLVGYEILKMIYEMRCKEVENHEMTIGTTIKVCDELQERIEARLKIKTTMNPIVMELQGTLLGMKTLEREIEKLTMQIDAFTPEKAEDKVGPMAMPEITQMGEMVTPQPEVSPPLDA